MTTERFNFQAWCVNEALQNDPLLKILNIGCAEDPANLKSLHASRVLNCDINAGETVDVVMDIRAPWPAADNTCALVVLGDILEHLYDDEIEFALQEAYRVSQQLCITVPEDPRFLDVGVGVDDVGGRSHCNLITEEKIKNLLEKTGWQIDSFEMVHYYFVPRGFFILCSRSKS